MRTHKKFVFSLIRCLGLQNICLDGAFTNSFFILICLSWGLFIRFNIVLSIRKYFPCNYTYTSVIISFLSTSANMKNMRISIISVCVLSCTIWNICEFESFSVRTLLHSLDSWFVYIKKGTFIDIFFEFHYIQRVLSIKFRLELINPSAREVFICWTQC